MILQYSFPPPICTLFHFSDADSDSDVELDSLCNSPGTRDSGINEDCILLGIGPWEGLLDVVKVREGEGEGGGSERQAGGEGERMEYKTYVEFCLSVCLPSRVSAMYLIQKCWTQEGTTELSARLWWKRQSKSEPSRSVYSLSILSEISAVFSILFSVFSSGFSVYFIVY